jgi:hypothetical protein
MTPLTRVPNSIITGRHGAPTARVGWALSDTVAIINHSPQDPGSKEPLSTVNHNEMQRHLKEKHASRLSGESMLWPEGLFL